MKFNMHCTNYYRAYLLLTYFDDNPTFLLTWKMKKRSTCYMFKANDKENLKDSRDVIRTLPNIYSEVFCKYC